MVMNSTEGPGPGVYRYPVGEVEPGTRLDQYLAACCPELSRGLARRLIDVGGVHLDGRRMRRCGYEVESGQKIELFVDGLPLEPFTLEQQHIVFQDPYLLVINKPAGIATQPTPARYRGTVYDALQRYLGEQQRSRCKPSIGMVQRLDRDTSGVMIFSTHPGAHKNLTRSFQEHRVDKLYLALVEGEMQARSGQFRSQLARRRSNNRTVSVDKGGRYAETRFRVRQHLPGATLVEVRLLTGRTHQIRVHFAEAGHPLLGDTEYGGQRELAGHRVPRQMLHALELAVTHPVTGVSLTWQAPVALDLLETLQHLEQGQRTDASGCP